MPIRRWSIGAALAAALLAPPLASQKAKPPADAAQISEPAQLGPTAAGTDDRQLPAQPEPIDLTPALERIERAIRDLPDPKDYLPALERLELSIREVGPKPDTAKDNRQESREIDGLAAQKEIASWAMPMFWAATASAAVACLGLFLIFVTLIYTRSAAISARRMVRESEKTTKAAIGTLHANRAWIVYERFNTMFSLSAYREDIVDGKRVTKELGRALGVKLIFTNRGASPTNNCAIHVLHEVRAADEKTPTFSAEIEKNNIGSIGTNVPLQTQQQGVYGEDIRRFMEREICFFIYCKIVYNDIYSSELDRITEVCIKFMYDGNRVDESGSVSHILSAEFVGEQNRVT